MLTVHVLLLLSFGTPFNDTNDIRDSEKLMAFDAWHNLKVMPFVCVTTLDKNCLTSFVRWENGGKARKKNSSNRRRIEFKMLQNMQFTTNAFFSEISIKLQFSLFRLSFETIKWKKINVKSVSFHLSIVWALDNSKNPNRHLCTQFGSICLCDIWFTFR